MNEFKRTASLWLYVIHSKNAEFVHMLEIKSFFPPKLKRIKQTKQTIF